MPCHVGDDVRGETVRHRAEPVSGRRRDHHHIGRVGGDHVADAPVREEVQHVRVHGPPAQRGERQRGDEARRRRGHEHDDVGSLDAYLWSFVDGRPITNHLQAMGDLPASTEVSDRMSKDMKRRGFRFVGTTICYSLMQACGLVNDHLVSCHRYAEIEGTR